MKEKWRLEKRNKESSERYILKNRVISSRNWREIFEFELWTNLKKPWNHRSWNTRATLVSVHPIQMFFRARTGVSWLIAFRNNRISWKPRGPVQFTESPNWTSIWLAYFLVFLHRVSSFFEPWTTRNFNRNIYNLKINSTNKLQTWTNFSNKLFSFRDKFVNNNSSNKTNNSNFSRSLLEIYRLGMDCACARGASRSRHFFPLLRTREICCLNLLP